jgi:hypothetical protein
MEKELSHVLKRAPANGTQRSWRCADEIRLAAYVDGTLKEDSRRKFERHAADCTACLSQLSFLMKAAGWPESGEVPPWLLTKAKNLVSDQKQKASIVFGWRWATATLAAVFVVTFLVALIVRLQIPSDQSKSDQQVAQQESPRANTPAEDSSPNQEAVAMTSPPIPERPGKRSDVPEAPLIRNGENQNTGPALLYPRDGAVLKRGSLALRWRAVSEAVFYQVSIINAAGEVLMSQQTEQLSMNIPADIQLTPRQKYFASVRAHLRDGKTARSSIVSFRVAE